MTDVMRKGLRLLPGGLLVLALCLLGACRQQTVPPPSISPAPEQEHTPSRGLQDFGDPNTGRLIARVHALRSGRPAATTLNILQFGDSHTASDTFTSGLRRHLQQQLGDAGIGWVAPMNVRGQAHQLVKVRATDWQLVSSRNGQSAHFPMGGNIATPMRRGSSIRFESLTGDVAMHDGVFLLRQAQGVAPLALEDASGKRRLLQASTPGEGWQHVAVRSLRLPFTIVATADDAAELGGVWLEKPAARGALVSPIGVNGARQDIWNRWAPAWQAQLGQMRADLVVLAYGTNEAFDDALDVDEMARNLAHSIRLIRQQLPEAVILLVGAPDALDGTTDPRLACALRRPAMYEAVKRVQAAVAQRERVWYWDWRAAMDGDCPALDWQARGWVGKDLVHFTMAGYQESARRLHQDLMRFVEQGGTTPG